MFLRPRYSHFLARRISHTVNLKRERQVASFSRIGVASFLFLLLVFIVGYSYWGRADTASLYPSSCLGSWLNVSSAAGKPDLSPDDSSLSFNGANSAVLLGGAGVADKQIFCSGFGEPDQRASSTLVSAQVTFSWVMAGKGQLNPEIPVSERIISTSTASSSAENQTETSSPSTTSNETPPININATTSPDNSNASPTPAAFNKSAAPNFSVRSEKRVSFFSLVKSAVLSYLFLADAHAQTEASTAETSTPPPPPPAADAVIAPASASSSTAMPPTDTSTPAQIENNTPSSSTPDSSVAPQTGDNASSGSIIDTTTPILSSTSSSSTLPGGEGSGSAPVVRQALFEVRYSFDGSVWEVAGRVAPPDFNESFPIPLSSHADLSHLQIALVPVDVSLLPDDQAIYLDGMTLTVSYAEQTKKPAGRPERISFSSDQTIFAPDEINDDAFDGSPSETPCVAQPFSQTIASGEQAVYNVTIPNNGFEFVTKLGNYPQGMTPVFMPVSTNVPASSIPDTQATTTASSTTDTSISLSTDGVASSQPTTTEAQMPRTNVFGQTTLVIDTTASTTPGSYTLVVLYGTKDADKNVSTGLCQINLVVR